VNSRQESEQEDVFALEGDVLDVSDVVRQNLLVEITQFPLCRPDCKGLCPQCGANLNHTTCIHQEPEEEK